MAAATLRDRALFWMSVTALCLGFLWLFSAVLTPFVLGAAIAYLLQPAVEKFSRRGFTREMAATLILAGFYTVILSVLILIVPFIIHEIQQAVIAAPGALEKIWASLTPHMAWLQEKMGGSDRVEQAAQDHIGSALQFGGGLLARIAGSGEAVAGFLAAAVITPVVSFFMMKEWPAILAWGDDLLPRNSRGTIKGLLHQIDRKIAGFVRGQLSVAFSLAVFYGVALTLAGLNYGFLIGFTAGILAIVPYVSSPFGLIFSLSIGWFQYHSLSYLAVLAGIFALGQVIETYFLTPRLLGSSVGLHPLWIIFAVMAGGTLFGMTGMLLGVPAAAIAGVLVSFALDRYRASAYYKGK